MEQMMKNDYCIYKHVKLDGEIFYIGAGTKKRPYLKKSRNKWWTNIVNKYEYEVVIIHENLTWEEACALEIKYIKQYGRKDLGLGTLVNLTDGGEGFRRNHSAESKMKMSESKKGNTSHKGFFHSEDTKLKIAQAFIGKNISDEHKNRISKSLNLSEKFKNSQKSEERIKKISESNTGKKRSVETKQKLSEAHKGLTSSNKGKKISDEQKEKIRNSLIGRKQSIETIEKRKLTRKNNREQSETPDI